MSDEPDLLARRVRAALDSNARAPTAAVLARIGGRSPRALADACVARYLRHAAVAAAAVFACLAVVNQRTGSSSGGAALTGTAILSVVTPDDADEATATTPGTFFDELFAMELPE